MVPETGCRVRFSWSSALPTKCDDITSIRPWLLLSVNHITPTSALFYSLCVHFYAELVHVQAIFLCHLQGAYTKISLQPTAVNKVTINIHTYILKHMASCVHNFAGLHR